MLVAGAGFERVGEDYSLVAADRSSEKVGGDMKAVDRTGTWGLDRKDIPRDQVTGVHRCRRHSWWGIRLPGNSGLRFRALDL